MNLPAYFRDYIASLKGRLDLEGFNERDVADIESHELIHDLNRIYALNQEIRSYKATWLVEHREPQFWPDDYLVIGDSGSGNYFCISLSGAFDGVVLFDHEMAEFTPFAPSLDDFYISIIGDMQPRKARYEST